MGTVFLNVTSIYSFSMKRRLVRFSRSFAYANLPICFPSTQLYICLLLMRLTLSYNGNAYIYYDDTIQLFLSFIQ